jgi:hypothetical protein
MQARRVQGRAALLRVLVLRNGSMNVIDAMLEEIPAVDSLEVSLIA